MKNFVQKGESLTLKAPHAVMSGDPALIGSLFGVALNDAASGAPVVFSICGVYELPAVTAEVVDAEGQKAYYDTAARKVTEVSAGNTLIGAFVQTKAAGESVAIVRLNGTV